jgi:hypothetical protein
LAKIAENCIDLKSLSVNVRKNKTFKKMKPLLPTFGDGEQWSGP